MVAITKNSYQSSAERVSGISATNVVSLNGFCGYCITACLVNDCFDSFAQQTCSHAYFIERTNDWLNERTVGWQMLCIDAIWSNPSIQFLMLCSVILMSLKLHGMLSLYENIEPENWISDFTIRTMLNAKNEKCRNEVTAKVLCFLLFTKVLSNKNTAK